MKITTKYLTLPGWMLGGLLMGCELEKGYFPMPPDQMQGQDLTTPPVDMGDLGRPSSNDGPPADLGPDPYPLLKEQFKDGQLPMGWSAVGDCGLSSDCGTTVTIDDGVSTIRKSPMSCVTLSKSCTLSFSLIPVTTEQNYRTVIVQLDHKLAPQMPGLNPICDSKMSVKLGDNTGKNPELYKSENDKRQHGQFYRNNMMYAYNNPVSSPLKVNLIFESKNCFWRIMGLKVFLQRSPAADLAGE